MYTTLNYPPLPKKFYIYDPKNPGYSYTTVLIYKLTKA